MSQEQISPEDFDWLLGVYRQKPEDFIDEVLGSKAAPYQIEIIRSVFKYKLTAVKTCNAVGKSYIAARIIVTYLMLFPGSIVVTTAPTWRQVTDVLWREIGTTVKQAKYKLTDKEVTQAGLNLDTNWFAVGLSTKRPENFFGYHAENILVVVDEAGGVEEPIFKGVAAITPNADARVLLIGNPTMPGGTFYDAFTKPALGYNCFTISAFDTPNFIDCGIRNVEDLIRIFTPPEGVEQADWIAGINKELEKRMNPTYRGLIAPSVVYGRFHEWGVDSPSWQALIMGEFPSQAENSLIPMNLVVQSMSGLDNIDPKTGKTFAELSGWNVQDGPPKAGLDMARFGSDNTVLMPGRGDWVDQPVCWNKADNVQSSQRVVNIIDPFKKQRIKIDDTGTGGGATDHLNFMKREMEKKGNPYYYTIVPYNMSSGPVDKEKFNDITSEMYWQLREKFMNKTIAFTFRDDELLGDLTARQWSITSAGKIKVESKDDYRKRTGRKSPDKADALALLNYERGDVGSWSDITPADRKTVEATRPITSDLVQRY